ncbi:hypothetical protein [Cryobacterium sp. TMT3-29-2]|uniref:hypothetical protein n=1 Tax=Cryobacterium sp. TMT3-29-2 TaxID=2555867 RepID=UPI0010730388|nr:hypothetical protein [Cryobacterium sp. TMT3-29-2]TFC83525.1 hypothetical protein E3O67_14460 [Cryobacterium sp. TMT3-29-2]
MLSPQLPHKRFLVVSNLLRQHHIEEACNRPNVIRFAGAVHDHDAGETHGHGILQLRGPRTGETVGGYFPVSVIVKPFIGRKGDTHSFARGVRYLTHEHTNQQSLGKYRYPDSQIFASEGYDWRADIDALVALEGQTWQPSLRQIKLDVMHGKLTTFEVRERYPNVYVSHRAELNKLAEDNREYQMHLRALVQMRDRAAEVDAGS